MDVGDIVAGKYRVDRVIGRGGMGMVVAARHLHLQQPVALKSLLPEAAAEPAVLERFVREARASAQLRGEHVCRVSDVGALDNGSPYLVMELLEGQDLASVLVTHGPLPVPLVVDYVLQACLGIAEAHALGVIHRDLKPANLFLSRRPDGTALVKVLDFGIARSQSDVAAHLTQTQAIVGSPGYMSPEQLRASRDIDVRSDIWGLGVILYELVSGARPFTGDTITEIALRVTLDPPPLLSVSLPRRFNDVILRCLEKDPAKRFPHLAALASALVEFGRPVAVEQASGIARVLNAQQLTPIPHAILDASSVAVTVPPTLLPGFKVVAAETTMGGAASSLGAVGAFPKRRRYRRKAMIAAAVVAAAVTAIVVNRREPDAVVPASATVPRAASEKRTGTHGDSADVRSPDDERGATPVRAGDSASAHPHGEHVQRATHITVPAVRSPLVGARPRIDDRKRMPARPDGSASTAPVVPTKPKPVPPEDLGASRF